MLLQLSPSVRWSLLGGTVLGVGLALLLGGCGQSASEAPRLRDGGEPTDEGETEESAVANPAEVGPPRTGQPAPALVLPELEGGATWDLSAQLDPSGESCPKALLVAFMASWCGYCAESLPTLRALEEQYPDLGVVTVTVDDQPEGRKAELDKVRAAGLTGPVLVADADTVSRWIGSGNAVPRYYFIDRHGVVAGQDKGFGDKVAPLMPRQAARALSR